MKGEYCSVKGCKKLAEFYASNEETGYNCCPEHAPKIASTIEPGKHLGGVGRFDPIEGSDGHHYIYRYDYSHCSDECIGKVVPNRTDIRACPTCPAR